MTSDYVIAYYPADAGTILCPECASDKYTEEQLADAHKFSVAFPGTEVDGIPSCDSCHEVIPRFSLTSDGVEALRESATPDSAVWAGEEIKADDWSGYAHRPVVFGSEKSRLEGGYFVAGSLYTGTESIEWTAWAYYRDKDEAIRDAELIAQDCAARDSESQRESEVQNVETEE